MAKRIINIGTEELAGDGETLRSAFNKVNENFTELYDDDAADFDGAFDSLTGKPTTIAGYGITDALELGTSSTTALAGDTALLQLGTTNTTALAGDTTFSFADITNKPTTVAGFGITDSYTDADTQAKLGNVSGNIIPDADVTYDIGSASARFRDLYLSGSTIDLGGATISSDGSKVALPTGSTIGGAETPEVDLNIAPEILEIQVDSTGAGQDTNWLWTWEQSTDSWTASHHIDIPALKSFKIGGVSVLNKTTLSASVLYAPGLTQVGTLSSLQVDSLTFDANRMTSNTSGLQIDSAGDIQLVTSRKITNVADPTSNTDVATKQYVDGAVQGGNVIFGISIDGLGTGSTLQNNVATLLDELSPAGDKVEGTLAKIYALATSTTVDDINVNANISKTTVAVDSAGTQNQSVIEDFSISNVTGQGVTTTYTRTIMEYEVSGGAWAYNSTTASAV